MRHRNIAMVVAIVATIVAVILISGYTLNPSISNSQPPAAPSSQVTTVSEPESSPQSVFAQAFNVPIEDNHACVFVEPGVIDQLQSMVSTAS